MSKNLKINLMYFYLLTSFSFSLLNYWSNEYATIQIENFYITNVILSFYLFYFLFILFFIFKEDKFLLILFKFIFFTILIFIYFIFEQSLIKLFMYSIGDTGGWIRDNIYKQFDYVFQWYEVLFWNFIFSLHYPIYIHIYFKPFVNHLENSIGKEKVAR